MPLAALFPFSWDNEHKFSFPSLSQLTHLNFQDTDCIKWPPLFQHSKAPPFPQIFLQTKWRNFARVIPSCQWRQLSADHNLNKFLLQKWKLSAVIKSEVAGKDLAIKAWLGTCKWIDPRNYPGGNIGVTPNTNTAYQMFFKLTLRKSSCKLCSSLTFLFLLFCWCH